MAITLRSLRTFFAIPAGLMAGSFVNMSILALGTTLIPPPAGADTLSLEGLKASMHLFQPIHFLSPFMAHALGTLAGAWVAVRLSKSRRMNSAWVVGVLFLVGGVINVSMLPSPRWFAVVDLLLAYLPMAWLAGHWAGRKWERNASSTVR